MLKTEKFKDKTSIKEAFVFQRVEEKRSLKTTEKKRTTQLWDTSAALLSWRILFYQEDVFNKFTITFSYLVWMCIDQE